MEEIKVGEYIRINNDFRLRCIGIGKVRNISIVDGAIYADMDTRGLPYSLDRKQVSKHSKNPIDVIEVGDYVNGYKVISIDRDVTDIHTDCIELDHNNYQYNFITINQIETIVTKEMMESISYKVKE